MKRIGHGWQANTYAYNTETVYKRPHKNNIVIFVRILRDLPYMIFLPARVIRWMRELKRRQYSSLTYIAQRTDLSSHLGDPVIEPGGGYYQKKVIPLGEYVRHISDEAFRECVDAFARFTYFLRGQGVIDKSFNFPKNFGIHDGRIILIDLGELYTDDAEITAQIQRRPWLWHESLLYSQHRREYFLEVMDQTFLTKK